MAKPSPSTSHLALPFGLALPSASPAGSASLTPGGSGGGRSPAVSGSATPVGGTASGSGTATGQPKRRRPAGAGKGKIRKRLANGQRNLADTELNEADDVDDSELIAGPDRSSRALAEADLGYGEADEDGDGDGDGDAEGDVEGDQDGDEEDEAEEADAQDGTLQAGQTGADGSAGEMGSRGPIADVGVDGVRAAVSGGAGPSRRVRRRQQQDDAGMFRPGKKGDELYDETRVKMRLEQQKDTANMLSQVISPDQAKRFEAFSLASLNRPAIKRLITAKYDQPLSDNLLRPLAGLGKVFVTEVTELAKDIQEHSPNPTGPLQPYHLKLAREVLIEQGILGSSGAQGAARRGNPLR